MSRPPDRPWRAAVVPAALTVAAALATGAAVWWADGPDAVADTLVAAVRLFAGIAPALVAGLVLAALLDELVPRAAVTRRLGAGSGVGGLAVASAAGAATPGGPAALFALAAGLRRAGADLGTVVAYVTGWSLLGVARLIIWELPMLGAGFAASRVVVSLPLPLVAGALARMVARRRGSSAPASAPDETPR